MEPFANSLKEYSIKITSSKPASLLFSLIHSKKISASDEVNLLHDYVKPKVCIISYIFFLFFFYFLSSSIYRGLIPQHNNTDTEKVFIEKSKQLWHSQAKSTPKYFLYSFVCKQKRNKKKCLTI